METIPAPAPRLPERPRPLQALEDEICELASQITAAGCRLLLLIAEFDAAEGWREWGMRSTAHWLSWKCGMGLTAAREQVRVARALPSLTSTREMFASGRLSYSKVRAITRVATPGTEHDLARMAEYATGAQMDRVAAGFRRVVRNEDVRERRRARRLSYYIDEDGSVVGNFRIPPEDAAVFLQALESACGAAETTHGCEDDGPIEPSAARDRSLLDGLVVLAQHYVAAPPVGTGTETAPPCEVVIHTSAETLAREDDEALAGSRTTSGARLHPESARRLSCDCSTITVVEAADGSPLHLGRRTRRIDGRLRRAVLMRDGGRCRAPGCTAQARQIHHVRHWAHGGPTCLTNLISLCSMHHRLVHEGGWTIAVSEGGGWAFRDAQRRTVDLRLRTAATALPVEPSVRADAVTGLWGGDPLSLHDAVDWLFAPANRN